MVGVVVVHPVADTDAEEGGHQAAEDAVPTPVLEDAAVADVVTDEGQLPWMEGVEGGRGSEGMSQFQDDMSEDGRRPAGPGLP